MGDYGDVNSLDRETNWGPPPQKKGKKGLHSHKKGWKNAPIPVNLGEEKLVEAKSQNVSRTNSLKGKKGGEKGKPTTETLNLRVKGVNQSYFQSNEQGEGW